MERWLGLIGASRISRVRRAAPRCASWAAKAGRACFRRIASSASCLRRICDMGGKSRKKPRRAVGGPRRRGRRRAGLCGILSNVCQITDMRPPRPARSIGSPPMPARAIRWRRRSAAWRTRCSAAAAPTAPACERRLFAVSSGAGAVRERRDVDPSSNPYFGKTRSGHNGREDIRSELPPPAAIRRATVPTAARSGGMTQAGRRPSPLLQPGRQRQISAIDGFMAPAGRPRGFCPASTRPVRQPAGRRPAAGRKPAQN